MTKKFLASRLFFTITNLLLILVKKPISLILFLQNIAQLLKITVLSPHKLISLPIGTWQTLNSRRMTLKESSVNSTLIKLMVIEPLFKIFKNCVKCGIFPDYWKKGNIVPIFKKGGKQNIKNFCPFSLLPICSKIFERIIYDNMLK